MVEPCVLDAGFGASRSEFRVRSWGVPETEVPS